MNSFRFVSTTVLATCLTASATTAQERDVALRGAAIPHVTISATGQGVRVAALGPVGQTRLEVFAPSGETVYSSGFRPGGVRDWVTRGAQGPALPDGTYLCVLTLKDLSGRVFVRQGNILLQGGEASLQLVETETAAATREESSLTRVGMDGGEAAAITAHDGRDGQVVSTSGDLTLRTGDFFSGSDVERVRITSEGRVGIGTDTPEATLDVAGAVRARGGFEFPDGSTLTSKAGRLTLTSAEGEEIPGPNAAGTGTLNKIAKWSETGGAGTLTDSTFEEDASGNVFNFTGTRTVVPGQQPFFEAQRNSAGDILQRFWNTGTGGAKLRYVAATGATSQVQLTDGLEWLSSIAGNNSIGLQFRVRGTGTTNSEAQLDASARMTIARNGNVGVGTTAPTQPLDVVGNVNTSTQYHIGGARMLSAPGTNNLFAGASAGNVNTGTDNTFIGRSAGVGNTSGSFNTYVGTFAGVTGATGGRNTAVGYNTSVGQAGSNDNAIFGYQAGDSQGQRNSVFGSQAGNVSTSSDNSFFGYRAGSPNHTGSLTTGNSFFGSEAGVANFGDGNSFFGAFAGNATTSGERNSFFGTLSGDTNTSGDRNTIIGSDADVGSGNLQNAIAIGYRALVTQSNSLVLGSISGVNSCEASGFNTCTTVNVGIGTTAPAERLHVGTGNIYVGGAGQGLILKSPNGSVCRRLTIDNSGNLVVANITCP